MYKFAAGIVLYNPDLDRLSENIRSIYEKVELLILVDNCSDNFKKIEQIYDTYSKILIISNDRNSGIAAALNQIMECGVQNGFDWVLTLDQDSICPDNLFNEYEKLIEVDKIAIISPIIIDRNKEESKSSFQSELTDFEKIKKCITSGSLTNANIWNCIGRFDEYMFIDEVDFEFCRRVINGGFYIVRANKVNLLHEIGHIKVYHFLFWDVTVKNHNAFRKYYIARNVIYVANKSYVRREIVVAYLRVLKIVLVTLLYERDKIEKIKSIFRGMRDGKKAMNINHR